MKYIKQFGIILVISFIGEVLHYVIPLQVPASIYGLVLMFLSLQLHVFSLDAVRETSAFLIDTMPLMFVPAGVGLMTAWGVLRPICIPIIIIIFVSTILVMAVSGHVTQAVIRFDKHHKKISDSEHIYYSEADQGESYKSEDEVE